jgi:predicted transcriptional regulator
VAPRPGNLLQLNGNLAATITMDKSHLQEVVATLPENVDLEAFIDRLYLLRKIEIGEAQIMAGEVVSHDEVKQQLAQWLE